MSDGLFMMIAVLLEFFKDLGSARGSSAAARHVRRRASLALGIGGAAVFTLVNAIVLRTLPVPEPRQLYRAVTQTAENKGHGELFSVPSFQAARDDVASKGVELAASTGIVGMQLQPDGDAIAARGNAQLVSGEFFSLLHVQPQLGRLLTPSDNLTVGAHPVAVISDAYWGRAFAAAPDVVGRHLSGTAPADDRRRHASRVFRHHSIFRAGRLGCRS